MQIKKLTLMSLVGLWLFNPAYGESQYQPQPVQYHGVNNSVARDSGSVNKQRADYKCFVDTNVGEGIYDFSWYVEDTQEYVRAMPGERLSNPNVPDSVQVYASKVHECVAAEDNFSIDRARVLDESRLL